MESFTGAATAAVAKVGSRLTQFEEQLDRITPVEQRERRTLLKGKLGQLQQVLQYPDGEAGEVNIYGIALLQVVVGRSWKSKVAWTSLALIMATVEVLALLAIAMGSSYTKCVYDDDCLIGTACVFVRRHEEQGTDTFYRQPICVDCGHIVEGGIARDPAWRSLVSSLVGIDISWPGHEFTPARTGDRWPVADTAAEYCENYLEQPFVQAWTSGSTPLANRNITDFSLCLHVQEALHRFGFLDHCVMLLAFFLVCISINTDRQQQLFNRQIRQMLLPAPWKDPYAAAFYVVELLLAALMPTVLLSMVLLLYSGSSMQATDSLLNGVAIAFVLVIDDELPLVFVSQADKNAIDSFASEAATQETLLTIKTKGTCHGVICFIVLLVMFEVCHGIGGYHGMPFHTPCFILSRMTLGMSIRVVR